MKNKNYYLSLKVIKLNIEVIVNTRGLQNNLKHA